MNVKQTAIVIAITVLFSTFVLVAIDAVYPRPEYDDYCNYRDFRSAPIKAVDIVCDYTPTELEEQCWNEKGTPEYDYDENGCNIFKECNYCSRDYDEAQKAYSNNLFYILAPFGAIAIIFGVLYSVEFIGSGFMFSGIFLMFFGTVQNFQDLNKFARVLVIFCELLLVMFIAYKKVMPDSKKTKDKKSKPGK